MPRLRSPPDAARLRSVPTVSARSVSRPPSVAWSVSSRPSDWSRDRPAFRHRHGRRWRIPAQSRARSPTPALLLEAIAVHDLRDAASLSVPARRFDATPVKLDGIRIGSSADFGYAAVAPDVRTAFRSAVEMLGSLGADIVPDCVQFEPDMLERILKPIAYTEQAAAVSARGADALMASDGDYRDVVAKALPTAVLNMSRPATGVTACACRSWKYSGRSMRSSPQRLR